MMVVPLFGLQYIITIYRHQVLGCDWQDLYQIFNNMIEGTTGAVVAIIFCYTNGEVKALLKRTWERLQERRTPRGVRGPKALHSRSFSTVQTTLLDPSPATRRNSSIVSICVSNQPFRRTSSGANASQLLSLHGSRSSIAHPSPVDSGRATTSLMSPRLVASAYGLESSERFGSSKSPVHNLDSSPIARSLSLFEEVEDETKNVEINKFPQLELATKAEEKVHLSPVAVFRNDNVKPCVNIIVNGQLQGHKTSEDQGYESSHNVGAVDE
nr:uncharacterized protein LOC128698149 [Cherax quadricarinatus]